MEPVIKLEGLTKTFGTSRGVIELNLKVDHGAVFGFLGPNGSGKSTTMNMLMGFTTPTAGSAYIFDKNVTNQGVSIRKEVGFLASDMALDGSLTGWQQLEYFGRLRGNFDKQYIKVLAERLDSNLQRKNKTLSRGNKQKVGLIAALMHKPKLLLLDEPTSVLDPLIQAEFNKIILEHKAAGNTAFISSHVLSEVQELCDRMIFIREGKIIANKSMNELTESAPKRVTVRSNDRRLSGVLHKLSGITGFTENKGVAEFGYTGSAKHLLAALASHEVEDVTIEDADLENLFIGYYEKEGVNNNA